MIIRFILMLVALLLTGAVYASPLPVTSPQSAGFSADGLSDIDSFFAEEIAANRVPGAVIAIARDGKLVHYRAYGYLDKAKGVPMPLDAIFGYASMTKIMTCVAALKLTQEGRLPLKSKLSNYYLPSSRTSLTLL
jgi:CubicO group peptidase (beta-lactamase class C family)